jgi:DNA-binding CsgD family transcriptional regulator/tetratricopeptide (TPR) repeat protein
VVRGEAGIGKTSVVKVFCDESQKDAHVLWGGCDDLLTPQPLGPIWDMTFEEPDLENLLLEDSRGKVFRAVHELLARSLRPTVMVIEDVHWADESTVDLIRYAGRRIDQTHGLLILTFRDDVVVDSHPIQIALGDLPQRVVEQIRLEPLTETTVAQLAGEFWDPSELWRITDGNPLFVTELLAAGRVGVPVSIRDAVVSKVLRLSGLGRELVELASVVPGRLELSVVQTILTDARPALEECERAGILEVHGRHLAFRHELIRRAVEDQLLGIRRRELNATVLRVLEARGEDVARCAHFAREAGDTDAILKFVPLAARRSSELEGHREALSQLRALEPFLDQMDVEQLAEHYDLWAHEEYLGKGPDAVALADKAIGLRRALGDRAALGKTLLLASDINWWKGNRDSALEMAREAVSTLESIGGEDLAMAYATLSRWAMVNSDLDQTLHYAEEALAQLDDGASPARAHILINRGTMIAGVEYPHGLDDLEEGYRMADELGLREDQIRAAHNIGTVALFALDVEHAERWLEKSFQLADEAEMPGTNEGVLSRLALINEMVGNWDSAEATARSVLEDPAAGIHQVIAGSVLARILTRRGQPGAKDLVWDAWQRALRSKEPQFLGLPGSVLVELNWLGTSLDRRLIDEIVAFYNRHIVRPAPVRILSELAFWLSAIGEIEEVPKTALEPFVLLDQGRWREAATFWEQREIPYETGLCLSFGDTEAKIEALKILDRLNATPLATKVRGELKSAGVGGIPGSPRPATRESPLGLTQRQTEVVDLLAEGMTNAEIADRLFISTRTVDHHVAAILSKLGAEDRSDAVDKARAAGVVP